MPRPAGGSSRFTARGSAILRPRLLLNLARSLKVAALLLFLLPWLTVSCTPEALMRASAGGAPLAGVPTERIARASGLDLAAGRVIFNDVLPEGPTEPARPFDQPDPLLSGAAVLIALAFAATFLLKGRRGALAAIAGLALAGAALAHTMLVRVPRAVRDHAAALIGSEEGRGSPFDLEKLLPMIQTRIEPGFWLTLAALAGAAVLLLLSMRGTRTSETPPPAHRAAE